ncbi:hypothetical protein [Erythrobacter dokdonensis]|uniref:hypothetical protein n=1 Tax=Erythrobacter dokdonensis TaxID=328225 RepID=UPI00083A0A4D|nr:hypothetical protein [Erythrobacter dokdonensis]
MTAARLAGMIALAAALGLPACKPPPTDAGMARAANLPAPEGPSEPLASPDTDGAVWAQSARAGRLVYGIPGGQVLVSLECLGAGTSGARLKIARHAPADEGAGALLALIGNRRIARLPVDATKIGGAMMWQGETPAAAEGWDALGGMREATVTVPGAGLVKLNPSPLPMQLVEDCRMPAPPADPA